MGTGGVLWTGTDDGSTLATFFKANRGSDRFSAES